MVVVVRDDLELSRGKMAVQVAHAAVSCSLKARTRKDGWFRRWHREGQRKVVLRAADLKELQELEFAAKARDLATALIQDAGLTEVPPGTTTCLGIGPGPEAVVDGVTGHLRLM